jgi:hypothetical protein
VSIFELERTISAAISNAYATENDFALMTIAHALNIIVDKQKVVNYLIEEGIVK